MKILASSVPLIFLLAFLIILFCSLLVPFYALVDAQDSIHVKWDMAYHGYWGVKIASDIQSFNPMALIKDTFVQKDYPFLHSYIVSLFVLVFGGSVRSVSIASYVVFSCSCFLLFFLMHEVTEKWKQVAGLIVCFIILSSPFYLEFSILIMLEILSSCLTLLTFLLYSLAFKTNNRMVLIYSFICAALVFFSKYNYGTIVIISLFLMEFVFLPDDRKALLASIKAQLRFVRLYSPVSIMVVLLLCLAFAVIITGGFEFSLGKQKISLFHIQNIVYLIVFICIVRFFRSSRAQRAEFRGIFSTRQVHFIYFTIFPVMIFTLLPGNLDALINFSINRTSGYAFWSLRDLVFYLSVIKTEYCLTEELFYFLGVLYVLSLICIRRKSPPIKMLHVYFIVYYLIVTLHLCKSGRFIFPAVPIFWIVAIEELIFLLARRPHTYIVSPLLAVYILFFSSSFYSSLDDLYQKKFITRTTHWFTVSPSMKPIIDSILREVDKPGNVVIIGTFNELSPKLLEWNILAKLDAGEKTIKFDFKKHELTKNLQKYDISRIICINLHDSSLFYSRDYILFNSWKKDVLEAVFDLSEYRMYDKILYAASGLELVFLKKVSTQTLSEPTMGLTD